MLRSRIIPCLLLRNGALVKTIRFQNDRYLGDPLNAVKLFNEFAVDELIVLDIEATNSKSSPDYNLIRQIAAECRMPLCYGGGIASVDQAVQLVAVGVEKIAVGRALLEDKLVYNISNAIGRQSVCAIINVKAENNKEKYSAVFKNAQGVYFDPFDLARRAEQMGAGEILVNFIDNDGVMSGYDLELAKRMRSAISTPLTILGGAGSIADMQRLIDTIGVCGAAAGSLFVFKGRYRAVLINYDRPKEL